MRLLEMLVSQFGVEECQKARSKEDISRLCRRFDPLMISEQFKCKHLGKVGHLKISVDITYPTEPWIDSDGNIVGIVISEQQECIEGHEVILRSHCKWEFKFDDILDARTVIEQFVS